MIYLNISKLQIKNPLHLTLCSWEPVTREIYRYKAAARLEGRSDKGHVGPAGINSASM